MAVDMFLKLGDIKGEASDTTNKDWIEILAWSWGLKQSGSMHIGTGGGSGKVQVEDLSVTKYIDSSTNALIDAVCAGKHFPEATLIVRKAAGSKPINYVTIKLSRVLVSSYSTGGSGGEDRLTENVTLNFGKYEFDYVPQDEKGAGKAKKSASWDISKNAKS